MNKNRRNVNSATYIQTLTKREYKAHIKATQQYTNTTQKAEDALHDSFVNVLEKDITLEYPKAYITYSSFNVLRNNSRHDNRTVGWTEATENYNLEPGYELKYYSDEYLVQEAISKLDPKQKLIMEKLYGRRHYSKSCS